MKTNQTESADNWSSILSDLGIENPSERPAETVQEEPVAAAFTVSETITEVRTVVVVEPEISTEKGTKEVPAETAKPAEPKKRFLDRFPKIDLFGPPKGRKGKSLEAVAESVRSPSLSGKSFTSNTIEKVPVSPERISKRNKEEAEKKAGNSEETKPLTAPLSIDVNDPWTDVASQVEKLGEEKRKPKTRDISPALPVTAAAELDEAAALSQLMAGWDSSPRFDQEAEKRLNSILNVEPRKEVSLGFDSIETHRVSEEPPVPKPRERGRREERSHNAEQPGQEYRPREGYRSREEERPRPRKEYHSREDYRSRGEGEGEEQRPRGEYRARAEERGGFREEREVPPRLSRRTERDAFTEPPVPSEEQYVRGRRGSRYQERSEERVNERSPQGEYRETNEEQRVPYSEQRASIPESRGRGRRSERAVPEPVERQASGTDAAGFRGVPGWDEAVFALIEKNMSQRSVVPPPQRRR
jgi:hypothetical protein